MCNLVCVGAVITRNISCDITVKLEFRGTLPTLGMHNFVKVYTIDSRVHYTRVHPRKEN